MPRTLYHYTSLEGHDGILKSKSIWPSLRANNPKDARHGDGQYFSDILPNTKRPAELSRIFFGFPWGGRRFAYHVDVDVDGLNVVAGRPFVFVVPNAGPLDITNRIVGSGRNL